MLNVQLLLWLYLSNTELYHFASGVKDIYGLKGGRVEFYCPYRGETGKDIIWMITDSTNTSTRALSINVRINNQTLEPELYNRLLVVGNNAIGEYNLQISDIRESDEGRYTCYVGSQGAVQQDVQTLYLIVPPSSVNIETQHERRVLGTEGQNLTVSCEAVGGKPAPSVTVKVDGTSLATGYQSLTYTFKSISRSYDRKTITCQGSNEANVNTPKSDLALFYLNIKPLQPTFSSDPVSTEESRPLLVSCTSTGSRPQATFKWTIGTASITSDITTVAVYNTADETYTVTSTLTHTVDRTYNGQTVICGAYNNVSTNGVIASKILDIKFAPNINVTNATFSQNTANRTVTCIPVGNPATYTYYRWQHKSTYGVFIRELDGGQNGVLTLPSVSEEAQYQDSGEYVCTASNGITGRDGNIKQTGSGYVSIQAQPIFPDTFNIKSQYGEIGNSVELHLYVYSFPEYTGAKWYRSSTQIYQSAKYVMSTAAAIVRDLFHDKEVQLDGYRITLTIKDLSEPDFGVSYRLQLSNGVGLTVEHAIMLMFRGTPTTPTNFNLIIASDSSIAIQWDSEVCGGYKQNYTLEYRVTGSSMWQSKEIDNIYNTRQSCVNRQIYILSGLQQRTMYELRIYSENKSNRSLPTSTKTIQTVSAGDSPSLFSHTVIVGVAGGLSALVILEFILIVLLLLRRDRFLYGGKAIKSGNEEQRAFHNPLNETKELTNVTEISTNEIQVIGFSNAYETLEIKDNPNNYTELNKHAAKSKNKLPTQQYEMLTEKDKPNVYEELNSN